MQTLPSMAEIQAERARRGIRVYRPSYLDYLKATVPASWTTDPKHIHVIAEHLDAVERGEIDRLAIHMPPRHAKTETVTVRYAAYCLENEPADNVLITGYNERFSRRLSRKARTVASSRIKLASDKKAEDEWATPEGGVMMARGVGSPPTGTGFRRIIIDDPIRRREDAESETYREKVWDWYTDDLYTRLEPGGAIVLVMTLWHEDDIGTRAVASEPGRWTVLKLPAIAEEDDLLGRAPGEALWPARYTVADLKRIKDVLTQNEGERSWLALYQQQPTAREGAFFKVGQFRFIDGVPPVVRSVRAWDIAATENDGDYTAGPKVGLQANGRYVVMDVVRGRWATDERNQRIRETAEMDGTTVRIHGPQDPGAAGKDAAQAFVRMLAGFPVRCEPVSGAKELRADPFSAQVNAGNVDIVRADWNSAFIEELRAFPGGKYDDQVDGVSDAFTDLATGRAGLSAAAGNTPVTMPRTVNVPAYTPGRLPAAPGNPFASAMPRR